MVTPSGIEKGPDVAGDRGGTGVPTEGSGQRRLAATAECNECNEALDAAREMAMAARRLAMVAHNALLNGDLQRARSALHELHDAAETVECDTAKHNRAGTVRRR